MLPIRFCAYQYQHHSLPTLVDRWKRAEALGFDVVWNCDTLNEPDHPRTAMFEAVSILTAMALGTSRIRVGTLVNTLIYRNPVVVAKVAMTVDHLSNGRLELGFGGGVMESDHAASGVPWWRASERVARFREAIQVVEHMLTNDTTTFRGNYYRIEEAEMVPRPLQQPRPPITIPAHGPSMLRVAAEFADSWSSWGGYQVETEDQMFALTRDRCARFDDLCTDLGRDPRSIRHSLVVFPPLRPWASVEACRDLIGRYRDIGIDEFVLYWPGEWHDDPTEHRVFEEAVDGVLPGLRGAPPEPRGTPGSG